MSGKSIYRKVLVAVDFSPGSQAALQRAVWLARHSQAHLTLVHTLPDLRKAVHSASARGKVDLLFGAGDEFYREVRKVPDARMRQMIADLNASDLDIRYETLLGEPFLEIIHGVQQEQYDLVLCGTRGMAAWKRLFVGSTANRLIRKCPCSVWIVKEQPVSPPASILAATDFSDASCRAVNEALAVAEIAGAALHVLHVVDLSDVPEELIGNITDRQSLLDAMYDEAARRLDSLLATLPTKTVKIERHLTRGVPWKEVERLAKELQVDLIALGTVGRSGIEGVLLGNTAEKVLHSCDCSVLTTKPEGFVSPIVPASWPAHPSAET